MYVDTLQEKLFVEIQYRSSYFERKAIATDQRQVEDLTHPRISQKDARRSCRSKIPSKRSAKEFTKNQPNKTWRADAQARDSFIIKEQQNWRSQQISGKNATTLIGSRIYF